MKKESNWIHEKLKLFMGPSLMILIGSSIFRGLLGLIIASLSGTLGTYNHWSVMIRLPIEIVVFFGVFISSDICFASSISNVEGHKRQLREHISQDPPRFKGNAEQQVAQAQSWQKQHDKMESFIRDEMKAEKNAMLAFGFISTSYALNFVAQSAFTVDDSINNILLLVIEAMSVIVAIYVIWYFSARYKADSSDPASTAIDLVETGMEKRLLKATDSFAKGEPTEEDLKLADVALPKGHHYKRFIGPMRRIPDDDELLTTAQIYAKLGINDRNIERLIRKDIKAAFDANMIGVYQEMRGQTTIWLVSGKAYHRLFKKYMADGSAMVNKRIRPSRKASNQDDPSGQSPVNDRTNTGNEQGESPSQIVELPQDQPIETIQATA